MSYAHFAGITLTGSHSSACYSVSQACLGSWIVDAGASDHMTHNSLLLSHLTKLSKPTSVTLLDGTSKPVFHIGQATLTPTLILDKVLHVPEFKFTLLSVSQLVTHNDMCVMFFPDTCFSGPFDSDNCGCGTKTRWPVQA